MSSASVYIYSDQIVSNAKKMIDLCSAKGISVQIVTKICSGYFPLVQALVQNGITNFCESRIKNIQTFEELGADFWMVRLPTISEVYDTVRYCSLSLNSEPETLRALNAAAADQHLRHDVLLMVEDGDLREGCLQKELLNICKTFSKDYPNLVFKGIGTNLSCYGGIIPSEENMADLISLSRMIEQSTDLKVSLISGGNSSSLKMLLENKIPKEINHFRLGESIFLGNIPCFEIPLEGFYRNNFVLEAEVIEVKEKPSVPWGTSLVDSFGHPVHYEDRGIRKRAILAVGRQDLDLDGIMPVDSKIQVLGASSDHLILDVTEAAPVKVGDRLKFNMNYAATLRVMTSSYIQKIEVKGILEQ